MQTAGGQVINVSRAAYSIHLSVVVCRICEARPNVIAYILNEVFEYQSTTLSYMSTIIQSNCHRLHHVTCSKLISCSSSCLHCLNHQLVKLRRLGALVRLSNLTLRASQTIFWTIFIRMEYLTVRDRYVSEYISQPRGLYHTSVCLQEDRCTSLPSFGLH